jgi:outer membrane protein assembly factor BamB
MPLLFSPDPIWSTRLDETPAGAPLAAGEWLLLATHQAGAAPAWSKLRWLNLADGQPGRSAVFEGALIGGIRSVRLGKPDRSGGSQDGVLVAVYSADALGHQGALLALDAAGEEAWRWAPGVSGVSAPSLAGDKAWVTTNTGFMAGLDLATGAEQARIALDVTPSLAAPALAGNVAYVPCRGPHLLAMGLDGQLRWRFEAAGQLGGWLNHTPALVGEHLFTALSRAGQVIAVRLADGAATWQAQVGPPGKDLTPIATDGERLYIGSREGLHALDPAGGRELWCFPVEHGLVAAPVAAGGVVYVAGRDHRLVALDAASGQEAWRYEVERRIEVSPLITAGPRSMAVVADHGGTLTALHRPLSAVEREAAVPSLAVEVLHGELVLNTWTRLRFVVRNQGGGPARQLIVHARGGQFEGQVADTRRITTVQAGQTREDWLDVRPLACGDSVPLRVSIEYQDYAGTAYTWQDTLYLPVAPVPTVLHSQGGGVVPTRRPLTSRPFPEPRPPSGKRRPGPSKESPPPETGKKDFFVSYNRADCQWAEWIAWQLEAAGYTTIIQAWDFRPGGNFVIEMQRAAEQARRTVAVLSPDYLQALYTQPEWAAAVARDPTGQKRTLLPVRVRECELQGLLSQVVYIDLVGLAEEAARETLLAGAKQGRAKPATAPGFPGIEEPSFPGTER